MISLLLSLLFCIIVIFIYIYFLFYLHICIHTRHLLNTKGFHASLANDSPPFVFIFLKPFPSSPWIISQKGALLQVRWGETAGGGEGGGATLVFDLTGFQE